MAQSDEDLIQVIRDETRACVERGEAIAELCETGMTLRNIAELTKLSDVSTSHLRTIFDNLKGPAREMCESRSMNADACYSLANAVASYRKCVLGRAEDFRMERQRKYPRGRRSPEGQITDKDMKAAIKMLQTIW